MSWTAPSGHVFVTGEVIVAANLRTYIANNLADLDRRSTVVGAYVGTDETTTSTSYAALATVGPAVTATTGTLCVVGISLEIWNASASSECFAAFDISGATTSPASDGNNRNVRHVSSGVNWSQQWGASWALVLTPGANTFTMKYRVGTNTGHFRSRYIWAMPMGSA